ISAASAQLIMIEKKLSKPTVLPGPTGESNTITLESRGCVGLVRDQDTSFDFWFLSLITALATGNTVVTSVSDQYLEQVSKLAQLNALNSHQFLAGTIVDRNAGIVHIVNQQLAARSGAILPLITAVSNQVLFERLVTEKTISVDTTAAGGNASLMTMEIED
ncbi:MAG: trifunctional transcriptional regulator/proline dehydrogenase/L-glutamate gamma-semialdehyde dehydrogenase, partial [Gammaproteobacteria bacterium]|nr:trifunctional transcriptional regulator/proline dehydrogenase/L-glutamate gamma-semialdehyde dehydrogenase [Gammaproteobacteria bacterium]